MSDWHEHWSFSRGWQMRRRDLCRKWEYRNMTPEEEADLLSAEAW
jgi:hypothetical protein